MSDNWKLITVIMTFAEYKKEIEERFGVCDILDVTMDISLKNADKTGIFILSAI